LASLGNSRGNNSRLLAEQEIARETADPHASASAKRQSYSIHTAQTGSDSYTDNMVVVTAGISIRSQYGSHPILIPLNDRILWQTV
jgi:hypothetical protein